MSPVEYPGDREGVTRGHIGHAYLPCARLPAPITRGTAARGRGRFSPRCSLMGGEDHDDDHDSDDDDNGGDHPGGDDDED
jgi:hypothetical protein